MHPTRVRRCRRISGEEAGAEPQNAAYAKRQKARITTPPLICIKDRWPPLEFTDSARNFGGWMSGTESRHGSLSRWLLRRLLSRAARRVLIDRTLTTTSGDDIRWLGPEMRAFLDLLEPTAATLRPHARLSELPSFGNRLMVELAVYTAAADQLFRAEGIATESSRNAIADIGWHVYRQMLGLFSLPFRMLSRNPAKRLRWTIRALLIFPFNAKSAGGYAVRTWQDSNAIHTHFSRCPPQLFARRLATATDDPAVLETFRAAWCQYDWPGADLIAGDGKRDHYARPHSMSAGDPVCDMCWAANINQPAVAAPNLGAAPD